MKRGLFFYAFMIIVILRVINFLGGPKNIFNGILKLFTQTKEFLFVVWNRLFNFTKINDQWTKIEHYY
jgi:hypothetical protein